MHGRQAAPKLGRHLAETWHLALPLACAQTALMAMNVTDNILLGGLGGTALAAGGIAANLYFTLTLMVCGALTAVSVQVARARGAGEAGAVTPIFRAGLLLTALFCLPTAVLILAMPSFLAAIGEPSAIVAGAASYLHVLVWGLPGQLLSIGLMRAYLPAIGRQRLILFVTLPGIALNAALGYVLIHGGLGLPGFGMRGSAAATAIVGTLMGAAMLVFGWPVRAVSRPSLPMLARLSSLLAIGLPVAGLYAVEMLLFTVAGLLVGLFGAPSLAGHQIALNVASTTFAVPLAIGQAANIRVAYWNEAAGPAAAREAGFVAIIAGALFMLFAAIALFAAPRLVISAYLDLADPANAATIAAATSMLAVAAIFQLADGVQTVAAGALRGFADTRTPMVLAALGYWGVGFTMSCLLAFVAGFGPIGIWYGLAIGLVSVAVLLTIRFTIRSRPLRAV